MTSGFFLTILSICLTTATFFLVIDPLQRPAPLVIVLRLTNHCILNTHHVVMQWKIHELIMSSSLVIALNKHERTRYFVSTDFNTHHFSSSSPSTLILSCLVSDSDLLSIKLLAKGQFKKSESMRIVRKTMSEIWIYILLFILRIVRKTFEFWAWFDPFIICWMPASVEMSIHHIMFVERATQHVYSYTFWITVFH